MILGDGPELRDYVTEMGIVEPLLRLIKTDTPVSNFVTDKTSEVLQVEHLTSYKKMCAYYQWTITTIYV